MQTSRLSTIDTALTRFRSLRTSCRTRFLVNLFVLILSLVSVCVRANPACALDSGRLLNAKDMFYQELKQGNDTAAAGPLSIAYCLELHRGSAAPVLCNNRYSFRSGDGIRLHVKASAPCYAYIVMVQGSSGKKAVLYPPPGSTENNRVEAGKECMVPPRGMIVFDNQPGTEKLGVIFSPQPLDNSRVLNSRSFPIDADALTGIPQKVGPYSVCSSDGVYELGAKAPGNGLVFVHNPKPGEPVLLGIVLNHGNAPPEPAPSPTPTPTPHPSPSPSPSGSTLR